MARLDGDSRELYAGEREAMRRKIIANQRMLNSQDPVRTRYDRSIIFARPQDDFRLHQVRTIERFSTGHRVDYKVRGFFRG